METIRFEPNVPVVLELKYDEGREVEGQYGPQFMYTTSDDRRVYLNPPEAEKITQLGIRRGMKFRITKQVKGKKVTGWLIERLDVQTAPRPTVVPRPEPEPPSEMERILAQSIEYAQAAKAPAGPQQVVRPAAVLHAAPVTHPVSPEITPSDSPTARPLRTVATRLISGALIASIDAYLIAVDYAKSKGIHATIDMDFNAEDIRSSATSFLIEAFKSGQVRLADAVSTITVPSGSLADPNRVNGGVQ